MEREAHSFSDEELTAFLDGEAEAGLVAQIEASLPALEARLAALDLPLETLRAGLDPAHLRAPEMAPLPVAAAPQRFAMWQPAALAASFALGAFLFSPSEPEPSWVDAVASYQALYVTETLSGTTQDGEVTQAVLMRAQAALGVDVDAARVLDGLTFKRAQMLAIGGEPLLQMAYLDSEGVPFAFCLTRTDGADKDPVTTVNHNLSTTSWVRDGVGFVLIGGDDDALVQALSVDLVTRL